MPIVVIGGGLTAIDTATESLAYYVVQVEKFLKRYETLAAEKGEAEVRAVDVRRERATRMNFWRMRAPFAPSAQRPRAKAAEPTLIGLLNSWGGVDRSPTGAA